MRPSIAAVLWLSAFCGAQCVFAAELSPRPEATDMPGDAGTSVTATGSPSNPEVSSAAASAAGTADIGTIPIDQFLSEELVGGQTGSFGARLRRYGVVPYIHGSLAVDWWSGYENPATEIFTPNTFRLREAHLYFGADIAERVIPEVYIQFDPPAAPFGTNGSSATNVSSSAPFVVHARAVQVDVKLYKSLFSVRAGLFLVPFGVTNDQLLPRFISKYILNPAVNTRLMTIPWAEMGVQALGHWEWAEGRSISYAAYVSSGTELDPTGRSLFHQPAFFSPVSAKSIGARVGFQPISGYTFTASVYSGPYAVDGNRRAVYGIGADIRKGALTADAEFVDGEEGQTDGTSVSKRGAWALVAWRFGLFDALPIEPVAMIDWYLVPSSTVDADKSTSATVGLNAYPFSDTVSNFVLKLGYRNTWTKAGQAQRFMIELALGF